jgi:hypothetical protein
MGKHKGVGFLVILDFRWVRFQFKNAFVPDHLEFYSDPYQWKVNFIRAAHECGFLYLVL